MNRDGVLLLGGGGFIGQALAGRLAAHGRAVHVVGRTLPDRITSDLAPGFRKAIKQAITHHPGSLDDAALLETLRPLCATVVHLASSSTPGSSARHAARELDNLQPTLRLLDLLRSWPDAHLIFLSSGGTVYGNPASNPVAEDAPLRPLSYHGAGKVALETFLQAYAAPGHPVTILRPSNTYGPGQTLRHGFGMVRTVLQHAMHGSQVEVWGDGESVRDYVYIDDVVEAAVRAIDCAAPGGVFNIGSGRGHSINALLDIAATVVGQPLPVHYRPARGIDVREVVLDVSRARRVLGWAPAVSLEEGLARTWRALLDDR